MQEAGLAEQPRTVRIAVTLLACAVLAAFAREIYWNADAFVTFGLLLGLGCLGLVIHRISLGRNWARLLFVAIVGIGMFGSVPRMIVDASASPATAAASFAILAVQLVALALLFTAAANNWFRKRGRASGVSA